MILRAGLGLAHTVSWVTEQSPAWQCLHVWEAPVFTKRTSVGLAVHARSVVAARSTASLVKCSGRAAGRVESGARGPSNQSQVLWLPDMSGALPTTGRSASRFTILNAAEIPYGSCVTPLHDRRGAGAVSGTASGPRRGHQLWHADARHRASSRMQGSDLGWTAFTGLLRAPVRACIAWAARRTWPTAPTPRG